MSTTPLGFCVRASRDGVKVPDEHFARVLAGAEPLLFDGAMGTMLQASGLEAGELPELLCLSNPSEITAIHRAYVEVGSDCVTTNTFGANVIKLGGKASVAEVFKAAVDCARAAGPRYVAADIGPSGLLLEPLGTAGFNEVYELFAEQVRAAHAAGADLVIIETMADLLEMKAAVLAAKENCSLPIFATMTFGEDGRTFLGTDPATAALTLDALGVNALGINCSLGPAELAPLAKQMLEVATCPVILQANAGLPKVVDGVTSYGITPAEYAEQLAPSIEVGVTIVGGCCGTDPEHIRLERALLDELAGEAVGARHAASPQGRQRGPLLGGLYHNPVGARHTASPSILQDAGGRARRVASPYDFTCGLPAVCPDQSVTNRCCPSNSAPFAVTSAQQRVVLSGSDIAVIGERINPTGKPKLKEALCSGEHAYVLNEAISQAEAGADILDVNVGLPELDEPAVLEGMVTELQGVCALPLQIDSSDPFAIERAVRRYAGKAMINSVNGKRESLEAVLPIAKHYGCAVVGLTLDEDGIPETAEGRFRIAQRIVVACCDAGIPRSDIAIDCLVMSAATDQRQPTEILQAVSRVKHELGVRTVLGVSNVSFGLPLRSLVNASFLSAAFAAGLDMPILNPLEPRYAEAVDCWRVLCGQDEQSRHYIECYANKTLGPAAQDAAAQQQSRHAEQNDLHGAVLSGRKALAAQLTREMLARLDGIAIIEQHLIPALDEVGAKFESGVFFLPQLMASAEAAKAGFDVVKEAMTSSGADAAVVPTKGPIVLATVKGDVHDIGKNIVKMLLENYGYQVIDLGRDVAPEQVLQAVRESKATLVGLSALMTTTVVSMEQTIKLLHEQAPDVKIMVGGAVLTPEYAQMVGADFYAKDAAASTRIASELFG